MQKKIILTFIIVIIASFTIQAQETFLWKINGNGLKKPSYLFGTYHLLNNEYLEQYPGILEKYNDAKVVLVESDADSVELIGVLMSQMIMQHEELSNLMDSADFQLVVSELATIMNAPPQVINRFKPAALSMIVSLEFTKMATPELRNFSGVAMDHYFSSEAKAIGKPVVGLENAEELAKTIFNANTLEEQARHLVKLLRVERDKMMEIHRELTNTYLTFNYGKLFELTQDFDNEYGSGDLSVLLDDRNKAWMPIIEKSIKESPAFIAVGAAHLPGNNGLIALLQGQGYKVKPVKIK